MVQCTCWLACALALFALSTSHAGKVLQVDTTPPQFSKPPWAASVSETSLMLRLALNEAGMTYFSILPAGSASPSASQVRQGSVSDAITLGTINAPAAEAVVSAGIDELPATKHRSLDIYLVAEDVHGNLIDTPHHLSVDLADFTEPSFPKGYPRLVSLGTEFASVDLGLDEPGFVYYLLQRATPAAESESIDPAIIKGCALHNTSCPIESFASAGKLAVGEPAVGEGLPYDGDSLFASYKLPYKPGNYWLHFAAEDDEAQPNLMRRRNVVRRRLATVQPPTWSDKGPDPFYVPSLADDSDPTKGYTVYEDPGITANNPDSKIDITDDVIMTHNVDTSMPGTYTVNFQVTYLDSSNQLVTGYENRTVIVTGPWAPAYKGSMNGINSAEGNNPGSCCEWYRTCRLEDYLWDCTQDDIDACKSTDTNAKCIICLQLDKYVRAGFGYKKYTHTKPDVSKLGQDAVFVGRIRMEEMERQKAMGNLPGLMGPKHPGYLSDPVHHLEKSTKPAQRSETAKVLENGHNWKNRLNDKRLDVLGHHNVGHRRLLIGYDGYENPSNVRHRNNPHRSNTLKGDVGGNVMRFPKFSVCRAVRYQCTAFQDAGSGKCLPVDEALRPWDYEMNHATFAKNEVRKNPLQKHLDEKVRNSEPVWQR